MRHWQLAFLGCAMALLALVIVASCRPLFSRKVSGQVLALNGTAEGIFGGKTCKTTALTESTEIKDGMRIRVSPRSRVDLSLLPGILIELGAETEIEIERLLLARDGDESIRPMVAREATIRLTRGVLFASVGRAPTRSALRITTEGGLVAAGSDRAFTVTAHEQMVRIVSVRGRVAFAPADGSVWMKINPGFLATWPGIAHAPQPAAESGAEAQREVAETIKTERQLRQLERENQASFRRWRNQPVHPADPLSKE